MFDEELDLSGFVGTVPDGVVEERKRTPLKAIKEKCIDCCGGNYNEVKLCPSTCCPLYPFRTGRNTLVKRELTEEQRQASAERLRKAREAKDNG